MAIRVLRLLEYVYETPERAAEDMANWTTAIRKRESRGMTMRSTALPYEMWEEVLDTDDDS